MDQEKALLHVGHQIEVVTYGQPPENVSVECTDCNEVVVDTDLKGQDMNQYEAGYQDLKPKTPLEDMFEDDGIWAIQDHEIEGMPREVSTPDERHFFPVVTKSKTVYEVIWGPDDASCATYADWETAYARAKIQARATGEAVTVEVTRDERWTIG